MIDHNPPASSSVRHAFAIPLSRRDLLAGTALTLTGLFAPSRGIAAEQGAREDLFRQFSMRLTEKPDLSPVTSGRILAALMADDPGFAGDLGKLAALDGSASGMALKAAAAALGLEARIMAITTAWYTGTIETKKGPVVVAYKDALMYRPVADGLTVPTYCNQGPIWWTGLPPAISRMPVNLPKVL